MKVKNNGKLEHTEDMKRKKLIFTGGEQKKYNLPETDEMITDAWRLFQNPKEYYDLIFNDNKLKLQVISFEPVLKVKLIRNGEAKTYTFDEETKKKRVSKAHYNVYKDAAIWELGTTEENENDDNNETEESYKIMRKENLLNHDASNIGDILDREQLIKDVKKMAEFLGFPEIVEEIDNIKFDGRLGRAAGQITFRRNTIEDKVIALPRLKVNPRIPNNKEGIVEYFNTIKHELAHGITKSGDGEKEFEDFCNARDIGLSHELDLSKYHVVCKECGEIVARYNRKGKVAKSAEREDGRYTCGSCGGELKLEQLY